MRTMRNPRRGSRPCCQSSLMGLRVVRQTSMARISLGASLGWILAADAGSRRSSKRWRYVRAALGSARAETLTKLIGALRTGEEAFQQSAQVKPGAADHDGKMSALRDFFQSGAGLAGVFAGGERARRIDDIDQMMRDAGAIFARGFGGADFEVAIDSNRVATDDLAARIALPAGWQEQTCRRRWGRG